VVSSKLCMTGFSSEARAEVLKAFEIF